MDVAHSDLFPQLSSHAKRASVVILQLATEISKAGGDTLALMGKVGTRLFFLSSSLECAAEPSHPDVIGVAQAIVRQLWWIFVGSVSAESEPDLVDIYDDLSMRLKHYDRDETQDLVMQFFQKTPEDATRLTLLCDRLQKKVSVVDQRSTSTMPPNVKVPEPNGYDESLNQELFGIIQLHTLCKPQHHEDPEVSMSMSVGVDTWHPTRLRLGGPFQGSKWAMFDVVISSHHQTFWNEFRWFLPTREPDEPREGDEEQKREIQQQKSVGKKPPVRFEGYPDEAQYDPPSPHEPPVSPGYICGMLGPDETLRVGLQLVPDIGLVRRHDCPPVEPLLPDAGVNLSSVLMNYGPLTIRDKIILAHTIAQAFWQLYASDLMQSVWTSDTIWFMPQDTTRDNDNPDETPDELPMNAYVAFDFSPYGPVQEWLDPGSWRGNSSAAHRFPHILALGVLLLEIGLGRSVGTPEIKGLLERGIVARLASRSLTDLKLFEAMKWDGFIVHKDCFAGAIKYCTTYQNWIHSSQAKGVSVRASRATAPSSDADKWAAISRRKELLYKNVIRPLAWIAQAFYEDPQTVTCAYDRDPPLLSRRQQTAGLGEGATSELARLLKADDTASRWLPILENFNRRTHMRIESNKREIKAQGSQGHELAESQPATFKVAILDTGYNPNMPFFEHPQRRQQLTWKDFVTESSSSTGDDRYGHGSFMAQLVMASSPLAHVYVARVALNEDGFSKSKDAIAKAVFWAGITEKVDIISMSFGFEGDDESVKAIYQAIDDVLLKRGRQVVFFSAASNNPSLQTNMFPARHPSVIAIHATDPMGHFIFNPSTSERILGAYGTGVPTEILNEITRYYPKAKTGFEPTPGSSIATAITAGIAATFLAHVASLGWPFRPRPQNPQYHISATEMLMKLRFQKGMKDLMYGMARKSGGNPQRLFLDPIAVWKWASKGDPPSELGMHWNLLKAMDFYLQNPDN